MPKGLDTKASYGLGVEYYAGLGPLDHIPEWNAQEHYVYLAFDLVGGPLELNIGIGKGLTNAANPRVAKTIVGFEL